jgi:hypothetical protein
MAENEILDLASRRWRTTRAALATPNMPLAAVAERVADDLNRQLNFKLSKAFRAGATLLTVLHASEHHPAAMRAAVENFQDQQLARIARNAIKATPTRDPAHIAQCATEMLLDGLMRKTLIFADRGGCFSDSSQRDALTKALQLEFDSRRGALASVIEASLRGGPVRQWRRTSTGHGRTPIDARALARAPLAIRVGGASHVQKQN